MTRSGVVLRWDDGPVLDKHSTGGVGDKVSLLLAPILAACGGKVPMISGRGLGHTGGTLDKLDSIPGYKTAPDLALLRATVAEAGCAIIGQTPDLAPADRRFYALRDATATVESIPLIVASILSKKLAAGLDALVMDVKAGSGAFLPERERSAELARAIVAVARGNGLACEALLTDMDQVLGRTAGNAVEVREALAALAHPRGAEPRLHRGHAGAVRHAAAARRRPRDRRGGARRRRRGAHQRRGRRALRRDEPRARRPRGHRRRPGPPPAARAARAGGLPREAGRVRAIAVREVGVAVLELGGGRLREDQGIDHAVGLVDVAGLGEEVGPGGHPLAVIHAADAASAERAAERIRAAFAVGDAPAALPPLTEAREGRAVPPARGAARPPRGHRLARARSAGWRSGTGWRSRRGRSTATATCGATSSTSSRSSTGRSTVIRTAEDYRDVTSST